MSGLMASPSFRWDRWVLDSALLKAHSQWANPHLFRRPVSEFRSGATEELWFTDWEFGGILDLWGQADSVGA